MDEAAEFVPFLKTVGLSRAYGGGSGGISDINLDLAEGHVLAVCGASGCGKTTLLRLIAGLEKPDTGSVFLAGRPVSAPDFSLAPHLRNCAMVFQHPTLWPHMSVEEHLRFVLPGVAGDAAGRRITEVLAGVELLERRAALPEELSGGEQQRLSIARAVVMRKKMLILDEPFSSLDFRLKARMIELVKNELRFSTIVHVTHDMTELIDLADMVLVMESGRSVFLGPLPDFIECFRDQLPPACVSYWDNK